jgi:glycosyltransferase involved in cell wall biosynthesis
MKKKKVLMVMRLYTGLETSLETGEWQPEGVPTVYNFINKASKNFDLKLLLTCKDSGKTYISGWKKELDQICILHGLAAPVIVLAGTSYFGNILPRKIAMVLRDLRHLYKIFYFVWSEKPDLIYCDGANVTFAYCLSKMFPKTPIVLRLLGICSFLRGLPDATRFVHRIYKLAFNGRFSIAIGTQDGTGTEYFFERMLNKSVPRCVLLNGTDEGKPFPDLEKTLPNGWSASASQCTTVLFVGRLEADKGIQVFVEAVLSVLSKGVSGVRAIIVGSGSLFDEVKQKVEQSGYEENFLFTGSVPHAHIIGFHFLSDIYVSTNSDGNLTNANLEAIAANACMIVPAPQHEKHIDVKTTEYLADAVSYFRHDDPNDLKDKILHLVNNPHEIEQQSRRLAMKKKSFMRSWDERVQEEIQILDSMLSQEV